MGHLHTLMASSPNRHSNTSTIKIKNYKMSKIIMHFQKYKDTSTTNNKMRTCILKSWVECSAKLRIDMDILKVLNIFNSTIPMLIKKSISSLVNKHISST